MGQSWSSHSVSNRQGVSHWLRIVSAVAPGLDSVRPCESSFRGEIASRRVADFGLLSFRSTGHTIGRRREGVQSTNRDHLLVSLQLSGAASVSQDGNSVQVGPGSGAIGLVNAAQPFLLCFPDEVHRSFVFVPRKLLQSRAPWLVNAMPVSLALDNPTLDILRGYIVSVADPTRSIDDARAHALLESFVGVLAIASELNRGRDHIPQNLPSIRRQTMFSYLRRSLTEPDMTPQTLARHMGISVRLVHKLFKESGTTFGTWLRNERLDLSARALEQGGPERRIAEVAFAVGFNDLSHFNKSFKARFGVTPKDWRAGNRPPFAEGQSRAAIQQAGMGRTKKREAR